MDVNEPQQSQLVLIPSRTASPKTSIFSARSMRSAIFDAALALAAAVVIYPWAIQFPGG